MKFIKVLCLLLLIQFSAWSQTAINCGNFCVLSIGNFDTLSHEVDVTIYNGDTNQVNYPSVRLVNTLGDTVGNSSNLYFFFAQLPGDTVVHTIPTSLTTLGSGFTGTVLLEDNSSMDICSYAYPMTCTVGVPELSSSSFSMYPNPSSEQLNFQFRDNARRTISIYDAQGRLVKEMECNDQTMNLRFDNDWNNGMYYVSVYSNKHRTIKKLVIKK